ncbi:DUF1064 domain-containing protein [Dysgonomonas sp. 37-18]|uniref:DUF1064 domain-containing protein n=1 Tax=Dysgonomonas sp. 37-18 TaxID=1895907 RepID=UPI000A45BFC2
MKYRNIKSGKYDSEKEKHRADLLKLLEKQGEISNLKEQVKFELIPSQKIDGKLIERACSYIADFTYCDVHGNFIVEDTKGFKTKDYIIKRKLMLSVHGIKIKEV